MSPETLAAIRRDQNYKLRMDILVFIGVPIVVPCLIAAIAIFILNF